MYQWLNTYLMNILVIREIGKIKFGLFSFILFGKKNIFKNARN